MRIRNECTINALLMRYQCAINTEFVRKFRFEGSNPLKCDKCLHIEQILKIIQTFLRRSDVCDSPIRFT